MIVEFGLNLIYTLLDILLIFKIPILPDSVYSYINSGFGYISSGAGILANYTPLSYLLILFFLILSIDAAIMIYHFVMWIIKKIPFAGVS